MADVPTVPVAEDELEAFRVQWKTEVLTKNIETMTIESSVSDLKTVSTFSDSNQSLKKISEENSTADKEAKHRSRQISDTLHDQHHKDTKISNDNPIHDKDSGSSSSKASKTSPQKSMEKNVNSSLQNAKQGSVVNKISEKLQKALEIYHKATQYERMGNLSSALDHYRHDLKGCNNLPAATKLDANVEEVYRKAIQTSTLSTLVPIRNEEKEDQSAYYTYYNFTDEPVNIHDQINKKRSSALSAVMRTLLDRFKQENPIFEKKEISKFSLPLSKPQVNLNTIPIEILIRCVQFAIQEDTASVLSLSLVCKKMMLIVYETAVWRKLCEFVHSPHSSLGSLQDEVKLYDDDWFTMFLEKPRLKYHGVYISRVNYLRQGYTETFNQPIHLITYYRYLRFYPDGRVVALTTTHEPIQVVKGFHFNLTEQKGLMKGEYDYSDGQVQIIMTDEERPGMVFKGSLSLSTGKFGRHNKLTWVHYSTSKKVDPSSESEIPLRTLRPFHFSKVKSHLKG